MNGMVFSGNLDPIVVIPALLMYLAYSVYLLFFIKNRSAIYSFILWSLGWAGIFLLLIKPNRTTSITTSSAVITPNQKDLPDDLKDLKTYTSINDLLTSDSYHSTDTLYVKDQNLSMEDLQKLNHVQVNYLPVDQPGIQEIEHSEANEGSPVEIKGMATPQKITSIELLLSGNELSSISPNEDGTFLTNVLLNSPGDYLLDVKAIADRDTLTEQLALQVFPESTLSFLMLNEFPSFESRYLKAYLSDRGHRVAARDQVSQNKYVTSFSNMGRINLNALSSSTLNSFNAFVISMALWNNIGSSTRANILDAVYSSGKALVLTPSFNVTKAKNLTYHEVAEGKKAEFYDGPARIPLNKHTLKTNKDWRSVQFQDTEVAVASDYGIGTVAIVGISESYPLLLSGNEGIYHSIWSTIFSDLAAMDGRKKKAMLPGMMWEGEAADFFYVHSIDPDVSLKLNQSSRIPLASVPFTPHVAFGTMYPPEGWNQIGLEDASNVETFYVYEQHSWPLIRRNRAQQAADIHNRKIKRTASSDTGPQNEISYIWGLLLFLSGMGGLWLKERISA